MRNTFSGSSVERESKKRHAERNRRAQENQLVGRSRRQREMDEAYDERRESLKKAMIEKQNNDANNINKVIGRSKRLILIPQSEPTQIKSNETKPQIGNDAQTTAASESVESTSGVKSEAAVAPLKPEPVQNIDPVTILTKIAKAASSLISSKFCTAIKMTSQLVTPEGPEGCLSSSNAEYFVVILFNLFMSPILVDEKKGGDARLNLIKQLIPNIERSQILSKGRLHFDHAHVEFDQRQIQLIKLAFLRATVIINSFNDDSTVVHGAITKLEQLIDCHHKFHVDELVRLGELNAYEATIQAEGKLDIKEAVALSEQEQKQNNDEGDEGGQHDSGVLSGTKTKLLIDETRLRENVIEDGLRCYFDLLKIGWAKQDVARLFLKAYHKRDCFQAHLKESIEAWQSSIKDGSAFGRSSSTGGLVQQAGISSHSVVDARTERVTYSSGVDTWTSKQKGVL